MEGNVTEIEEDVKDSKNLRDACSIEEISEEDDSDIKPQKKSIVELSKEEETLKTHLDKLKKENYILQTSIKAWQTTLEEKLDEFKQADLKLDEIHNEIWSERERFCSKADEFNDSYGILSDWWAAQMKFVSDLENLEKKHLENRQCREDIETLEREVEELRKEIKGLRGAGQQQVTEVEVHATADEGRPPVREEVVTREVATGGPDPKKMKHSDRIEVCEERQPTMDDLYSIVDLEKLRMVNRNRNRHRKNRVLATVKKILTM